MSSITLKAKRVWSMKPKAKPFTQRGFGTEMPPQRQLVEIYFDQKELISQANAFYDYYKKTNWCSPKGTPYRNWKLLAGDWIFNYLQERKLEKRQRGNALL